mgnify:CR=1 FL=1
MSVLQIEELTKKQNFAVNERNLSCKINILKDAKINIFWLEMRNSQPSSRMNPQISEKTFSGRMLETKPKSRLRKARVSKR